jgi:hypothetical protein
MFCCKPKDTVQVATVQTCPIGDTIDRGSAVHCYQLEMWLCPFHRPSIHRLHIYRLSNISSMHLSINKSIQLSCIHQPSIHSSSIYSSILQSLHPRFHNHKKVLDFYLPLQPSMIQSISFSLWSYSMDENQLWNIHEQTNKQNHTHKHRRKP